MQHQGLAARLFKLDDRPRIGAAAGYLSNSPDTKLRVKHPLSQLELGTGIGGRTGIGISPRADRSPSPVRSMTLSDSIGISDRNGELVVRSRMPRMVRKAALERISRSWRG